MPSITQERIGEFVKTALEMLAENDDHLPSRDVIRLAEPRLKLNDYEREILKYFRTRVWRDGKIHCSVIPTKSSSNRRHNHAA